MAPCCKMSISRYGYAAVAGILFLSLSALATAQQTHAPDGRDYCLSLALPRNPPQVTSYVPASNPAQATRSEERHPETSSASSTSTVRVSVTLGQTHAPWSPFLTPHNSSCAALGNIEGGLRRVDDASLLRALHVAEKGSQAGSDPDGIAAAKEKLLSSAQGSGSAGSWQLQQMPDGVAGTGTASSGSASSKASSSDWEDAKDDTVVLFYGGSWCSWSRAFWPVWTATAARFQSVCMIALDAYEYPSLNTHFGIYGFPTILGFRDGKLLHRYSGDRSLEDFLSWIVNTTSVPPVQPEDADESVLNDEWANGPKIEEGTDWYIVISTVVTTIATAFGLYQVGYDWFLRPEPHSETADPDNDQGGEAAIDGEDADAVANPDDGTTG